MPVRVQAEDFDAGLEINQMRLKHGDIGAVSVFIGQVRDLNEGENVQAMTLEYYPGMTEKCLETIVDTAKDRWKIVDALVIHRFGKLLATDQIVLVVVTGAHRGETFEACQFIMDYLKTEAPFWKKESTPHGERWVEAKQADDAARDRWKNTSI